MDGKSTDAAWARRRRFAERFVIGLLFAAMLIRVWLIWSAWTFDDVNAYLAAAHRLRDGQPLYAGNFDPDSYRVFRYAPWFAWLWVPLSYLPRDPLVWGWGALLAGASGAILVGLARLRRPAAWALALLIAPWLLSLVQVGNVQPIVVALLAFGISRRAGPIWVGVSASLKLVPMLWVLPDVARRQWRRAAVSIGVAAVLLAPMLLTDLSAYTTDPGRSFSLYYYVSPTAWAIGAGVSTLLALVLAWRRSPYVWVATALAVMLVPPRSHITYATFLVIGLLNGPLDRISSDADPG
jgi:Glycosyltransferase family 87